MIQWDRIELLGAIAAGAVLGSVSGIVLGHERLGIVIWALAGAVVVGAVFYFLRAFRQRA
jgi:glucose-6-phosphate-specific signal transduction histidine kinase